MKLSFAQRCLFAVLPLCAVTGSTFTLSGQAPRVAQFAPKPILSVVHDEMPAVDPIGHKATAGLWKNAPVDFRQFSAVQAGQSGQIERITFTASATTTLNGIKSTKDFVIENGGSCAEGKTLAKGDTCTLFMHFEPQGPGRRLGKVTIDHTAAAKPEAFGLGGYGYAPALTFTPSSISTVPGTYPSSVGLLSGAQNLTVDGSDTVFISDTGHGLVRSLNSNGTFETVASNLTGVWGIAVDAFGSAYYDVPSLNNIYVTYQNGSGTQLNGGGTDSCTDTDPACLLGSEAVYSPEAMSINSNDQLFFMNKYYANFDGVSLASNIENSPGFLDLYVPFSYDTAFAVDAADNLYSVYTTICIITQQSLYNAEQIGNQNFAKIAGEGGCGFSGDGGLAGNAQIGGTIGQMTFDIAGNLYFTDTANQRVRRIDYLTGQINTIAGNGTKGYTGDGGAATGAALNTPTGVGVDSQGQVYIISSAASGQVVRKVGVTGYLNMGSVAVGTTSPTQTVTLSNTGNSNLNFTRVAFSSNTDYSTDPNATSCNYTVPLAPGTSCKIGFIFKPTVAGTRSAALAITDDTATGVNTIQITGAGIIPPVAKLSVASIAFPATKVGSGSTSPVTITNSGGGTLTISAITNTGTNPTLFTHTSTCGGNPLAAGASCTVQVTFSPTAVGSFSATLNIADNAPNSPQTITLTGTGTANNIKNPIKPKQPTVPVPKK